MDGTNTGSLGISAGMTIVVWCSFLLLVTGCLAVGFAQMRLKQGTAKFDTQTAALLRRRLASGKIDDQEYVRQRFELQSR
jgi:uncharacterized membrane protein